MKTAKWAFLLAIASVSADRVASVAADESGFVVIVNAENPATRLSRAQIAEYYLKKDRTWPDGSPVRFFDRRDDFKDRRSFLQDLVKKSPREVDLYWIGQKLYTGDSAPTQLATDSMVISLVSRFKGAIGYVSAESASAPGVKKIEISEDR